MNVDAILMAIRALTDAERMELFARLALQYPEHEWDHPMIERNLRAAKARADEIR